MKIGLKALIGVGCVVVVVVLVFNFGSLMNNKKKKAAILVQEDVVQVNQSPKTQTLSPLAKGDDDFGDLNAVYGHIIKQTYVQYHDPVSRKTLDFPFLPECNCNWVLKNEKHVLEFISQVKCQGSDALMVDVGMNDGGYSLIAAARGCRVVAFELQNECIYKAKLAFEKNNLMNRIKIVKVCQTFLHSFLTI